MTAQEVRLSTPPPLSVPESSLDRLLVAAHLFALDVAPPKGARVEELACGAGSNLIPLAARYPEASFFGFDENAELIAEGREIAALLKLKNLSFERVEHLPAPKKNTVDYLIAHNLLSRISKEQQENLFRYAADALSGRGLLYLSYQTLPGWYTGEGLRRALQLHVSALESDREKVAQGRAFLEFMSTAMGERTDPYALFVKHQQKRSRTLGDGLFFQEFLISHQSPRFFHEAIALADRHGFRFLAESNFVTMQGADLPEKTNEQLRALKGGVVVMEQYLDFIRNRAFRHSIFCRRERQPDRTVVPERIEGLGFATPFRSPNELDMKEGVEMIFRHPGGAEVRVSGELIKRVLVAVSGAWPAWRGVDEISRELGGTASSNKFSHRDICAALLEGYRQGVFEAHSGPPPFLIAPPSRPKVWGPARIQATRYQAVTNLRHESVVASDPVRALFALMDGTRDERQLVLEVEKLVAAGTLVERDDRPQDAKERLVKQAIQFAASNALLER